MTAKNIRNFLNFKQVAVILLPYNVSIILKLKGHIKGRLISRILNFFKNLSSGLKIIR